MVYSPKAWRMLHVAIAVNLLHVKCAYAIHHQHLTELSVWNKIQSNYQQAQQSVSYNCWALIENII